MHPGATPSRGGDEAARLTYRRFSSSGTGQFVRHHDRLDRHVPRYAPCVCDGYLMRASASSSIWMRVSRSYENWCDWLSCTSSSIALRIVTSAWRAAGTTM